ncbi:hypothetical protein F2Q69_00021879 [Brassica cretica]|uniref:Uncharacterized protein n=1 Tax=Brassica cretica TaxID=69181 RepID=A0A8S9QIZ0_BRACR|nr:hypothetical protein F2Q69_00021879 [Brassica cretica]
MINGERETRLVAQDQDPYEVLDAKRIQLAYRNPEMTQHTDDGLEDREPQTAMHYECLVTSKEALRWTTSALSTASEIRQLLLFVLIGDFFLFCHWFFERGAFPSRSASGPSRMSVDVLVGVVGAEDFQSSPFRWEISRKDFDRKVVPA